MCLYPRVTPTIYLTDLTAVCMCVCVSMVPTMVYLTDLRAVLRLLVPTPRSQRPSCLPLTTRDATGVSGRSSQGAPGSSSRPIPTPLSLVNWAGPPQLIPAGTSRAHYPDLPAYHPTASLHWTPPPLGGRWWQQQQPHPHPRPLTWAFPISASGLTGVGVMLCKRTELKPWPSSQGATCAHT